MRKKRVMLWSLLCGVFLVGGASYLSKTEPEPLKAAEKTTATKTEKTAPVAKAKPVTLVARDEKSGIPILTPGDGDLPNFYLSTNPDFTRWDTVTIPGEQFAGMPTGWTTVYSDSTNMSYYANPTDKNDNSTEYDPDNWDMLMQRSQILSGGYGTVYFNWQRVQGGGIKTMTSYSAKDVYNRLSGATLGVDVIYNPEMGSVFTVAADLQRTQMPTQKMGYLSHEPGYQYVTVSLFRGGSPNAVLANSVMTSEDDLSVDKVFEMVLDDNKLDEITNPSKGNNKIQLTTSNRMPIQWNSLAFYATNLKLTLKDDFPGFTVPVGASFEDYFGQQAFVDQINSAEYHGVADGKTVTEPIDLENITLEGILDHAPDTSRVGERTIQVVFTATHDGKELRGIAAFPLHVTWGNSVALGGGTNYPANMSSIAFSLLKSTNAGGNDSYELIANNGNGTYDTVPVNSAKPDDVYYQVDYFAPAAAGETLNLNQDLDTKGSINLTAKGSDTPADLIAGWGKQEVAPGGVLRVYMSEPTKTTDPIKQWLYQNNDPVEALSTFVNKNYIFYQVTENGLEPLYTNQMSLLKPAKPDQLRIGTGAPALALTNLFNNSDVANSRYLKPYEGQGTVEDYHIVWDFQKDAGKQSGYYPIPANAVIQKKGSSLIFTVPFEPSVYLETTPYVPWLPDYTTKWLNSATATIPGENAFVLRYSENETLGKTTVEAHSSGFEKTQGSTTNSDDALSYNTAPAGVTQWAVISNVGYYNGQKIAVKISLKPEVKGGTQYNTYIGVGKKNFFTVALTYTSKSVDVEYEFLAQTDEKYDKDANDGKGNWPAIKLSGFWTFNDLTKSSNVSMPKDQFDHIYSYNRDPGDTQIHLKYAEEGDSFILSSDHDPRIAIPAAQKGQVSATVTYNNLESFKYKVIKNIGNPTTTTAVYYSSSFAKIGIPKLQGIEQTFAKVTADQYPDGTGAIAKPINYAFVQMIPYESSEAYRNQPMEWTLPTDSTGDILQSSDWKIFNEEGTDVSDSAKGLFTIVDNTVTAQIENKDLYDHTYVFQRNMEINDANEVKTTDLDNNYLTLTTGEGAAKLTTVDQNGTEVTYDATLKTKVNFAADLAPYTYVVGGTTLDEQEVSDLNLPTSSADVSSYITHGLSDLVVNAYSNMKPTISKDGKSYSLKNIKIGETTYTVAGETLSPELTEKIKYTNTPVTLDYEEFIPWLPLYGKWLNSAEDMIPGSNAFALRFSSDEALGKTEPVAMSEGLSVSFPTAPSARIPFPGKSGTQWVVMSNVGYYNGQKIAVKMSVTPGAAGGYGDSSTYMGVGSGNLFNVQIAKANKSAQVKYEFLAQTDEAYNKDANDGKGNWPAFPISGYWTFTNLNSTKDLSIPTGQIDNIYSYNRDEGDTQIQLKYAEDIDKSLLTIFSDEKPGQPGAQNSATVTYTNKEYFTYDMQLAPTTSQSSVNYTSMSYTKIGIPKPQGMTQTVATVTKDQYPATDGKIAKPINNQFIQMIPYEDTQYYDQQMEWTLPDVSAESNTLQSNGQWTIVDETGTDAIGDGRFAVDQNDKNKVAAADITNDNLYNHTYVFQRNLVINDQAPVADPVEENGGQYLDNTGKVSLEVKKGEADPNPVTLESDFHTKVNFAADLGFAYHEYKPDDDELVTTPFATTPTYGEAAKEVPTAGTGLITHSYNDLQTLGGEPLGENENLMSVLSNINVGDEGYTLNPEKSDPALSTPVKFTTGNNSKLAYALGAVFTFDVTPNLDFGTPKIGTKDIRQTNDWSLNVANTPKASKISVSRTPFKAENVERLLGAQLLLKFDDNATLVEKEIPVSTEEAPASVDLKTLAAKATWTIDALATPSDPQMPIGFSLKVPAWNITKDKEYKSEITFTLTDAP